MAQHRLLDLKRKKNTPVSTGQWTTAAFADCKSTKIQKERKERKLKYIYTTSSQRKEPLNEKTSLADALRRRHDGACKAALRFLFFYVVVVVVLHWLNAAYFLTFNLTCICKGVCVCVNMLKRRTNKKTKPLGSQADVPALHWLTHHKAWRNKM